MMPMTIQRTTPSILSRAAINACQPRMLNAIRSFEKCPGKIPRNIPTRQSPLPPITLAVRQYSPAGNIGPKHEILPSSTPINRSSLARFLNPWIDMADVTDDDILAFKVESVTRTFGVVAALMCSLSAAALAVMPASAPTEDEDLNDEEALFTNMRELSHNNNHDSIRQEEETILESILQHLMNVMNTNHVAGTSLLVSWGVPAKQLSDIYSACCAASFYSSVCAMGLSAVLNAWLGCTPAGGTKHFVRYHSLVICSIPGFLAISTGLAGVALFIGLDRAKGTPISYIGLGGTLLGGIMIGSATARGMVCTFRLLTPLIKK